MSPIAGAPRRGARLGLVGAVVSAVALIGAVPASAKLTAPEPNSVQRGDVHIVEDTGGTASNTCTTLGLRAESTITIYRQSDGEKVFEQRKADRGGWETTWETEGAEAGTYRITSVARNRSSLCSLGAAVTLSDYTFEFRPWEYRFHDVLGRGGVDMNTSTKETQAHIGDKSSHVNHEADGFHIVTLPKSLNNIALPEDPSGFEPPETPESCDANPDSCEERLVVLDQWRFGIEIKGVFDLKTKAFIAHVAFNGESATMVSAGTDLDGRIGDLKQQIIDAAKEAGLDPEKVLQTKIGVTVPDPTSESGGTKTIKISVEEGVEIIDGSAEPGISGIPAVNAGGTFHLVIQTGAQGEALPYDSVTESRLIPKTPPVIVPGPAIGADTDPTTLINPDDPTALPPLGLILLDPGGPVRQVKGSYTAGTHSVGSYPLGWSVDTTPGATDANGNALPLWVPVLSAGTVADTSIDWIGHGIITNTETCLLPTLCIGVGLIIGDGVGVYGESPLSIPTLAALEGKVSELSPVEIPDAPEIPAVPLPELPAVPGAPEVPGVPTAPGDGGGGTPGVPSVPSVPEVPGVPAVPGAPELPSSGSSGSIVQQVLGLLNR